MSPKFDRTPLKEAVAWFRTAGDLNIILDELAIEDEGVTGTSPVTLELNEVAIHSALRLLLKPLNLGITIDEESSVVIVTSKLRMQGRMVAAAYPVAGCDLPGRGSGDSDSEVGRGETVRRRSVHIAAGL